LETLALCGNVISWDDTSAVLTLLSSLVAHPSLRELNLEKNEFGYADGERDEYLHSAGATLFALVAANAPALTKLDLTCCSLMDKGLRLMFDALPHNTHLRTLFVAGNHFSEVFARDVVLPAVQSNTSLLELEAHPGGSLLDSALQAEDIVNRRRAAP
jgi:hypothetical protein